MSLFQISIIVNIFIMKHTDVRKILTDIVYCFLLGFRIKHNHERT